MWWLHSVQNECRVIYSSVWTLSPPPPFFPSLRTNKQCVQSGTDVLLRSSPKILAGACCHQLYPEHFNRHADADVNLPQQQFHRWEGRYLPVHPKNGELGRSGPEIVGEVRVPYNRGFVSYISNLVVDKSRHCIFKEIIHERIRFMSALSGVLHELFVQWESS